MLSKMRQALAGGALAVVLGLGLAPIARAADAYALDPVHTSVIFRIKHMNVSYTYGRFNGMTGTVAVDDADPRNSTIELSIATDNVDTGNKGRDTHLKTPDFFDAKQFPAITFKSTAIKLKETDKGTGAVIWEVTGDLTLHGVTKSIVVNLERTGSGPGMKPGDPPRVGFETTIELKRSDYGMTGMLPGVGDDVRLMIGIEAVKK